MQLAAVVVFIVEVLLSHTPGPASGAQSQSLSRLTHLPEPLLRRAAHVLLFAVLALLAALGFGWYGTGFVALWSVIDEATKPLIPGRHFSWIDVGLNLVGCALGTLVWLAV